MPEDTRTLTDHMDRAIRLTPERWQHILDHKEMAGQEKRLTETLLEPNIVIATRRDPAILCYHRQYEKTPVTRKYMMVAVKLLEEDAFVITAHFMSKIKRGKQIWPE